MERGRDTEREREKRVRREEKRGNKREKGRRNLLLCLYLWFLLVALIL